MLRNQSRLEALMADRDLEALVATTAQNVRYITDYELPSLYIHQYHGSYGIALRGRQPVLVTSMAGLEYMVGRPVATSDIRTTGTYVVSRRKGARLDVAEEETLRLRETCPHYESARDAIVAVVRDAAVVGASIGIDESGVKPSDFRSLSRELGDYHLIEASDLFKEIRAVKTPDELALLRQACTINEEAAAKAFATCACGVSETAVEAVFRSEAARLGADPVHWETTMGSRSSGSYYASDYVGQYGDIIRSELKRSLSPLLG